MQGVAHCPWTVLLSYISLFSHLKQRAKLPPPPPHHHVRYMRLASGDIVPIATQTFSMAPNPVPPLIFHIRFRYMYVHFWHLITLIEFSFYFLSKKGSSTAVNENHKHNHRSQPLTTSGHAFSEWGGRTHCNSSTPKCQRQPLQRQSVILPLCLRARDLLLNRTNKA